MVEFQYSKMHSHGLKESDIIKVSQGVKNVFASHLVHGYRPKDVNQVFKKKYADNGLGIEFTSTKSLHNLKQSILGSRGV